MLLTTSTAMDDDRRQQRVSLMPYRWRCGEGNGMLIISSSSISFNSTTRSYIEEREEGKKNSVT